MSETRHGRKSTRLGRGAGEENIRGEGEGNISLEGDLTLPKRPVGSHSTNLVSSSSLSLPAPSLPSLPPS